MHKVLTQGFNTFLRRRPVLRHFERRPLPGAAALPGHVAAIGAVAAQAPAPMAAQALGQSLLAAAAGDPTAALALLESRADGLHASEAARRLLRDGPNDLQHEAPLPAWLHLWRCYLNPFNVLLTAVALLSFLSADANATLVIGVMVVLSTGIRFGQEGRSQRAADSLRAMVSNTATVIRRNSGTTASADSTWPAKPQDIPLCDLVSGDIVTLSAGDMIPADCRLLGARDLFVAQSAMTGESMPGEKFVQPAQPDAAASPASGPLDRINLVFMGTKWGTNRVSGTATALVVATSGRRYFGTLAVHAAAVETPPNAFQAGVNSVSRLLIRFAAVMLPNPTDASLDGGRAMLNLPLDAALLARPQAMTLVIMAVGLWLPMGPLASYFKFQALPPAYFGWLACIRVGYCVLITLMKRLYIRRFGWQ